MSDTAFWKHAVITETATLLQAVKAINKGDIQIAFVTNNESKLVGTITDGDVRRALLSGRTLDSPAREVMNREPKIANENTTSQQLISIMRNAGISQLPVIDSTGTLIDVKVLMDLVRGPAQDNHAVLMAGGFGRRLKHRTENAPKPLLSIGDKPILETILENFIEYGFGRFTISVYYLADQIKEYFGDGSKWGAEIDYIEEEEPLGTAGALGLIKERPEKPFFVMNGDVLTKVNFRQLLRFHEEHHAAATMCVRGFEHQVPYGVVQTSGVHIQEIKEKPVQNVMVNAGIYALSPETLDLIPHNEYFDMPSLYSALIAQHQVTVAYPVHEYWIDVGQPKDFDQAHSEYDAIFKNA